MVGNHVARSGYPNEVRTLEVEQVYWLLHTCHRHRAYPSQTRSSLAGTQMSIASSSYPPNPSTPDYGGMYRVDRTLILVLISYSRARLPARGKFPRIWGVVRRLHLASRARVLPTTVQRCFLTTYVPHYPYNVSRIIGLTRMHHHKPRSDAACLVAATTHESSLRPSGSASRRC